MNIFSKFIKEWKEDGKRVKEEKQFFKDHRSKMDRKEKQAQKDIKEAEFFENNILNSEIITNNKGSLPIKGYQIGNISIDKEKKIAQIEIKQAEIIGTKKQGAWYQVPFYAIGYLICKNIEYKIGETDINGAVFLFSKQEKKLKLLLNNNRQGVEIICEEIKVLDFKEQKIGIKDFQNIHTGMKWGKYFNIRVK
jgi:hypothetical protein